MNFIGATLLRQKYFITDFSDFCCCSSIFGFTVISTVICHFRGIFIFSFNCTIIAVLDTIWLLTWGIENLALSGKSSALI
jgi:hypothetical protein